MSRLSPLVDKAVDGKYNNPSAMKQRKTRSDKKHDIRIPVNKEEKWWMRLLAGENGVSMTKYSTRLVEKGLTRNYEYREFPYFDSDNVVHAKVDQQTYKEILHLAAAWDCSVRQATYRIFKHMLILEVNEG